MTDPAIIEAAARAMCKALGIPVNRSDYYVEVVEAVLAAVTPLIRAAVLDEKTIEVLEAALEKIADECDDWDAHHIPLTLVTAVKKIAQDALKKVGKP